MKIRSIFYVFSIVTILFSCQNEKKEQDPGRDIGDLHISKQTPQPGDTLLVAFRHQAAGDEDTLQAYYHYFVGTKAYPEDIALTDSAGVWYGQVIVPDSATVLAFNFHRDYKPFNNSGKGFVQPLYDENGQPLPGSSAGTGHFYQYYGGEYETKSDSVLAMIEADFQQHPELENEWDDFYARLLYSEDKTQGEKFINKRTDYYSKKSSLSEEEYTSLANLYRISRKDEKSDSINKLASEKFPKGNAAKSLMFDEFYNAASFDEKEQIFQEFREKFGENPAGFQKDYMAGILASHFAQKNNVEKFQKYSDLISNKNEKAGSFNNLAWGMAEKGENLELAEEISKTSLVLLEEASEKDKPEYLTKKQFESNKKYSETMYLDTYAFILFKQGKIQEAIKHQEKAVVEGKNSEYNERYLTYLMADKNYPEVLKTAEGYLTNNTATSQTKDFYREAYIKSNGNNTGLDQKLAELEEIGRNNTLADLKKEMLNEEAPLFDLVDLQGDKVSLASLKGKTVILDFWATWCGPCTASFPGMQLAVDNFKDDENVKFLFVNTMEDGPSRKEDVAGFIKNNNYSFHVVMDQPESENSRTFKTAADYNVSGIPTKIIIGPEGKMNFKKVGYGGNNEKMVQELELMIELLNSNEKATEKAPVS
ncbi:TlpA family protein disulfide reductase [Antarcticibacterium sp. 1MA-6-2]|uniref:TlpA family protein disulfide reductase n=1 Tax=Antarcticibacterium sp. 1MA-6-2 TaxID=2908210 RepID=UPI001F21B18B|nr:TlpA disulfide reductase family protein [Antarcticibacterium sp. 1MA-6-2]UJH92446.1 TlpA family protein disulfide reductase [Antarcticibacterium sp. 1MA-6-2]